jgi:thiamine biosynthesis lipoprotein
VPVATAALQPVLAFDAIGTRWQIDAPHPLSNATIEAVHRRIDRFDRTWSRFRADSTVRRIATSAGRYELGDEGGDLFALYERLHGLTDGAVSPLVGRSLEHLGYDPEYSLRPGNGRRPAPAWPTTVEWDGRVLTASDPVLIDIGAAGKGYLVDLVCDELREAGLVEFVVDAGGDIRHVGTGSIRVALEHPANPRKAIGVVMLSNGAICASAVNRRSWADGVHHVVDARTGAPTEEVVSSWAMADTALVADGVATALFFTSGPPLGAAFGPQLHWVRVDRSGTVTSDVDLPGEIFR